MTTTVSCRLEDEYLKQLRQLSDRTDRTVSRTLRRIVVDALTRPAGTEPAHARGRTRRRMTQ